MARVSFDSIFTINRDGSIEPKQVVRIGGVTLSPGVKFSKGVAFGGVDITQYAGHELEITTDNGIIVVTGIY